MINNIILASASGVRKKILDQNNIFSMVDPANIDEDQVKIALIKEKATPKLISQTLAELKANVISKKKKRSFSFGGRQCYRFKWRTYFET